MVDFRILIFSLLGSTATVMAVSSQLSSDTKRVVWKNTLTETGGCGGDTAWALLAEAEELCRARRHGGSTAEPGVFAAAKARRAIAREALDIASELTAGPDCGSNGEPVIRTARWLRRQCAGALESIKGSDDVRFSLDGTSPRDRRVLVAPFLGRLNEASSRVAERRPRVIEKVAGESSEEPSDAPAAAVRAGPSAGISSSRVENPQKQETAIKIGRGSSKYRTRLRRWSAAFRRESGALRAARSRLQTEVDARSMAEARSACRSFGLALARLDSTLVTDAPSRGLALRIQSMTERYWHGVAKCLAGRTAAAFAYLSEGDREWSTIAAMAARALEPRPMRPPSDASGEPSSVHN